MAPSNLYLYGPWISGCYSENPETSRLYSGICTGLGMLLNKIFLRPFFTDLWELSFSKLMNRNDDTCTSFFSARYICSHLSK